LAGLGAGEQQVLLRALAKEPGKRYPNCLACIEELAKAALLGAVPSSTVLVPASQPAVGTEPETGGLIGTVSPHSFASPELMPQRRPPAVAMETVPATPPNSRAASETPEVPVAWNTPPRPRTPWIGMLFVFLLLAGGVAVWWYFWPLTSPPT